MASHELSAIELATGSSANATIPGRPVRAAIALISADGYRCPRWYGIANESGTFERLLLTTNATIVSTNGRARSS
jgi:hypothetical protein